MADPSVRPNGPEVFVPFAMPREQLPPASKVRSTLIASSLRALRDRGHFDRYVSILDPQWRDTILGAVAGVWIPIDAGVAHYKACDALGLSAQEQVAIGREVGDRVQGTFLGTMVRTAKSAGVTPWHALAYTGRLYERLFEGGGCAVFRVGPKDARADLVNNRVVGLAYFRNGFRGLYQTGIELFCTKAYVTEIATETTESSCALKIAWA